MIRDFIYHIAPAKSLVEDIQPDCGYIIISTEKQYKYLDRYSNVLLLQFADTEDKNRYNAISGDDVEKIISFLKECTCKDIFVACDAGESRSPAIAAGLIRIAGGDDSYIFHSKDYRPNILVYSTVLEYGSSIKFVETELKRIKDNTPESYRKIKSGDEYGRL